MTLEQLPRTALLGVVQSGLPADKYDLVDHQRSLGTIAKPTVQMKLVGFEPLPTAPLGALLVKFVLTVATPSEDDAQREADLDSEALELVVALEASDAVIWRSATKVLDEGYLAYDIDVELIATYTAEPEPQPEIPEETP